MRPTRWTVELPNGCVELATSVQVVPLVVRSRANRVSVIELSLNATTTRELTSEVDRV